MFDFEAKTLGLIFIISSLYSGFTSAHIQNPYPSEMAKKFLMDNMNRLEENPSLREPMYGAIWPKVANSSCSYSLSRKNLTVNYVYRYPYDELRKTEVINKTVDLNDTNTLVSEFVNEYEKRGYFAYNKNLGPDSGFSFIFYPDGRIRSIGTGSYLFETRCVFEKY